jgi:hypothetical protein
MLLTLHTGQYSDRRTRQDVNCSQTIWIFATNAADNTILDFSEVHKHELFELEEPIRQNELILDLAMKVKKRLKSEFGVRIPKPFSHQCIFV